MVMPVVASFFVPFSVSPLLSFSVLPNTQDLQDVIEAPRNYSIMLLYYIHKWGIHSNTCLPSLRMHNR